MIHPYRVGMNNRTLNYDEMGNLDVPFYPGVLKDGKYVVLFNLPKYGTSSEQEELLNTKPAIIFQIKNGKKDGPVTYFTHVLEKNKSQKIAIKGQYANNQRTGRWIHYAYTRYGLIDDSLFFHFDKDVLHGKWEKHTHYDYKSGMNLHSSGYYKEGIPEGEWLLDNDTFQFKNGKPDGLQKIVINSRRYNNARNIQFEFKEGRFTGNIKMYGFTQNNIKYLQYSTKLIDSAILRKINPNDSAAYYCRTSALDALDEDYKNFVDYHDYSFYNLQRISKGLKIENPLEFGLYEIAEYDSTGKQKYSHVHLGDFIRISEFKKEYKDQAYRYVRKKKRSTREYYTVRMSKELKLKEKNSVFGNIYVLTVKEDGKISSERTFYVKEFNIKLLESKESRSYYYFYSKKEDTGTLYHHRYTKDYYKWKFDSVPKMYLSGEYKPYNKYYSKTFALRDMNYEINSYFYRDSMLQILTDGPAFRWLDSSHLEIKNASLNYMDGNYCAWIQTDTIDIHKSQKSRNSQDEYGVSWASEEEEVVQEESYPEPYPSEPKLLVHQPKFYYNGKAYSGELQVVVKRKGKSIAEMRYKNKGKYNEKKYLYLELNDYRYGSEIKTYYYFDYMDGLASGEAKAGHEKFSNNSPYAEGIYNDGKLNGEYTQLQNDDYPIFDQFQYTDGELEGIQQKTIIKNLHSKHSKLEIKTFNQFKIHNGKREGAWLLSPNINRYSNEQVELNFVNDKLNGGASINRHATTIDSFGFLNNQLHGGYTSYYYTYYMRKNTPALRLQIDSGRLINKGYSYFISGELSAIVEFHTPQFISFTMVDSNYRTMNVYVAKYEEKTNAKFDTNNLEYLYSQLRYQQYKNDSRNYQNTKVQSNYSWENLINISRNNDVYLSNFDNDRMISFNSAWNGHYQYFYKSGLKSQEGEVRDGERTGWWKFYSEGGNLYKEIEYVRGTFTDPVTAKTIEHSGFCKAYDRKGNKLYEGYITDVDFTYTCATDANISFENVYYTKIYDTTGNNILTNASTTIPVSEYQLSGAKLYDGWWKNGNRDSIWYFYNASGLLNGAGKYANGNKNGRWIEGDLSGINYVDNACFSEHDSYKVREMLKNLDFTESIYNNGKLVNKRETEVNTDGFSTGYGRTYFDNYKKTKWFWSKKRKMIKNYGKYTIRKRTGRYDDYSF